MEEELTEHLGHVKHQAPTGERVNKRNRTRTWTVLTDTAGEVTVAVPRDRAVREPVIVKKRQRRVSDVDAVAISLFAKGLTTGEISAHSHVLDGASLSQDTVSRSTAKGLWRWRPVHRGRRNPCAWPFHRAIHVKVRDGQVGNPPFYAAIGVDLGGRRLWTRRALEQARGSVALR